MSKRPRDEFFEVFRRSPAETNPHTPWSGIHSGTGDGSVRRRVLTVSYGILALLVTIAVVLAIMAYALGYSRGKKARRGVSAPSDVAVSSGMPVESSLPESVPEPDVVPVPPAPGEPFYTVRVTSAVPLVSAVRLRDDLRDMGYRDVFVYDGRGTTGYTVNTGRFASLQDRPALDLKEKVRKQDYKGTRPFGDAYIIKISAVGRIVE